MQGPSRHIEAGLDWLIRVVVVLCLVGSFFLYQNQQAQGECLLSAEARVVAATERLNTLNKLLVDAIVSPSQVAANASQQALVEALATGDQERIRKAAIRRVADLKAAKRDTTLLSDVERYIQEERNYSSRQISTKEACR